MNTTPLAPCGVLGNVSPELIAEVGSCCEPGEHNGPRGVVHRCDTTFDLVATGAGVARTARAVGSERGSAPPRTALGRCRRPQDSSRRAAWTRPSDHGGPTPPGADRWAPRVTVRTGGATWLVAVPIATVVRVPRKAPPSPSVRTTAATTTAGHAPATGPGPDRGT